MNALCRILFVIGSSQVGGAENLLVSLLRGLPRERFMCTVVCPASGPMVARYAQFASQVVALPSRSLLNPAMIFTMASLIRRMKIDVVQTCLYTSDVAGILAARIAKAPRVMAHIVGRNFIVTEERGVRRLRKQALSWGYRLIYRFCDQMIAVSEAVKDDLINRRGLRVSSRKIVVIRPGIRWEDLSTSPEGVEEVKQRYSIGEDSVVLTMVASFIPIKGHRYLVEALKDVVTMVPRLTCVLVGDGPCRHDVEQLVGRLGLHRHVVFTSTIGDAAKNALLRLSRAVVLPSLSEGLPLSVLEAMACGKPVIASDVGGIGEAVEHGLSGYLVPPRDAGALADAIRRVACNEPEALRLGQRGRQRVEEAFSLNDMIFQMQRLCADHGVR